MTAPTPAMRQAMAEALVGDDVWGEDPTVAELERQGAELLGKEAAIFLPSGTMANQVAIHVHCRPGDELICEQRSHVYWYEGGGIARLSGTQVRPLVAADGFPTPTQVAAEVRSPDQHFPRSRLLVLENSHNMAGGRTADVARMAALAAVAHAHDLAVHVDGARLINAAVALGVAPRELIADADSSTLCLSKGLGAPVGSLLAGRGEFIEQARRVRKSFGGGMRQAGVLAAAGMMALRDGPELVARDHDVARRLAQGLAEHPWAQVELGAVDTNIVMVDLVGGDGAAEALVQHLRASAVLAAATGPFRVRFVTHRDLPADAVERCLRACVDFVPPTASASSDS